MRSMNSTRTPKLEHLFTAVNVYSKTPRLIIFRCIKIVSTLLDYVIERTFKAHYKTCVITTTKAMM